MTDPELDPLIAAPADIHPVSSEEAAETAQQEADVEDDEARTEED